jgi:hypothetical protein
MHILKVIDGKCDYCSKDKEVAVVEMSTTHTVQLCFKDLEKQARIYLKEKPNAIRK